jgi:hypothetical protein
MPNRALSASPVTGSAARLAGRFDPFVRVLPNRVPLTAKM